MVPVGDFCVSRDGRSRRRRGAGPGAARTTRTSRNAFRGSMCSRNMLRPRGARPGSSRPSRRASAGSTNCLVAQGRRRGSADVLAADTPRGLERWLLRAGVDARCDRGIFQRPRVLHVFAARRLRRRIKLPSLHAQTTSGERRATLRRPEVNTTMARRVHASSSSAGTPHNTMSALAAAVTHTGALRTPLITHSVKSIFFTQTKTARVTPRKNLASSSAARRPYSREQQLFMFPFHG